MKILEPKIFRGMKSLIVGINPVEGSVIKGHFFSNNSYFFTLLKQAGITERKVYDDKLKYYGIGIMNYVDYVADTPKNVPSYLWNKGAERLSKIILEYEPSNVIFLGKFCARHYFNMNNINYGCFASLSETLFCCVPFPTFPMKKEEKLSYYRMIK